jgi:anti-sigma B factor antagonist
MLAMLDSSRRPTYLHVSFVPDHAHLFLTLRGELDLWTARQLPREAHAMRPDLGSVRIDLGELEFCDSAGIRALLAFRRIHERQGRTVTIVRATPTVWRLLEMCGVTDHLVVEHPTAV